MIVDKGDVRTKGHKHRKTSDRKSANTWTSKNNKVSFYILDENTWFTYHSFFKEGNRPPYQVTCWEKTVNGEDSYKDYLATGHE